MIICLNGYPGVGKTFICRKMVEELGFTSLEIGQKLRAQYGDLFFTDLSDSRAPQETEQAVREWIRVFVGYHRLRDNLVIDSTPRTTDQCSFLVNVLGYAYGIGIEITASKLIRVNRAAQRSAAARKLAAEADLAPETQARIEFEKFVAMGTFHNEQSWEDYDARGTLSTLILQTWARRGTPGIIHGGGVRAGGEDHLPDTGPGTGGAITSSGQSPGDV